MIYFDNSATSFYKPNKVKQAVNKALNFLTANPGRSGHQLSTSVGEMVFDTREIIKSFFHAPNHQVVFTKNCTEALNLAIFGLLENGDHVVTTCYEHNSVLRALEQLKEKGVKITILDCELNEVDKKLADTLTPKTKLVIATGMSNVTGQSPNLDEIGKICKENHVLFLVDGAQSSGHMKIDLERSNIDMYAFAGHKGLCAITGVGGLLVKNEIKLNPILFGGTGTESENLKQPTDLPEGLEAGTLPTIPIASLKAGTEFMLENFDKILKVEQYLTEYMYQQLVKIKKIKFYSTIESKNVFSFNVVGLDSGAVADILNQKYKICVRSGLHCAPLIHKKLGSLQTGAVRASIDFNNTIQEIDYFIKAIKEIANED